MRFDGGPYRGRTGDLHNAIVALSQTELTAQNNLINIAKDPPKVNEKFVARPRSFRYFESALTSNSYYTMRH